MVLFGRKISPSRLPVVARDIMRMLFNTLSFKHPWRLINSYFRHEKPPGNTYQLRSGQQIILSSNAHDSVTVMVIFCRKEYGSIEPSSIVIDIGANIGIFSLYAAFSGAKKVYAFEPNPESFVILQENIKRNGLEDVIIPFQLGVSEQDGRKFYISAKSSPYNKVGVETAEDSVEIDTITLASILNMTEGETVDLCKIDCEGAEYDVLFKTDIKQIKKIRSVRMEHHDKNRKQELIDWFAHAGYKLIHDKYSILWFS